MVFMEYIFNIFFIGVLYQARELSLRRFFFRKPKLVDMLS